MLVKDSQRLKIKQIKGGIELTETNIGYRIKTDYKKPDFELVKDFQSVPVANIGDAMGRFYIMDPGIKTVNKPDIHMVGTALTVRVRPGDNLMIHKAVDMAKKGDVLVIDAAGSKSGVWGELLSLWGIYRGINGIVIDGGVRDKKFLWEKGFPVFARHTWPSGGDKDGPGEINYPISCGNIAVNPGDIIVGDADGVVVIPQDIHEQVLKKVQKVMEKEKRLAEEIKNGKWERAWVDEILEKKGFTIE